MKPHSRTSQGASQALQAIFVLLFKRRPDLGLLVKSAFSRPSLPSQLHLHLPHSQQTPVVLVPKILFHLPARTPHLTASDDLIWGLTGHVSSTNHSMVDQIWDSSALFLNVGHETSQASLRSEYPLDVLQRLVVAAIWVQVWVEPTLWRHGHPGYSLQRQLCETRKTDVLELQQGKHGWTVSTDPIVLRLSSQTKVKGVVDYTLGGS